MVEVGTTNRTRIADYERAITADTGLLMKVHTSNYRVVGFTEEVPPEDLARLGRDRGVTSGWDLGSGRIEAEGARSLEIVGDETVVKEAVASGVDVVAFSGDKLLGGPQAGLIVGRRAAIRALRKNPIYRALRLDKVALSGLSHARTPARGPRGRAARSQAHAPDPRGAAPGGARSPAGSPTSGDRGGRRGSESQPGSGSAPTVFLPSVAVRVSWDSGGADRLADVLRAGEPPVYVRIHDGRVLLDPRALLDGDEARLLAAFRAVASA